ncbi:MAG: family 16 glycosylhydrolase [Paracoccaceae bacterium]|nr:family 16 glycosylhydrolase [Paracoccaceae bacterium]
MNGRRSVKNLVVLVYRISFALRSMSGKASCGAFSRAKNNQKHSISHIVTINLDRHVARWHQMQYELKRIKDREETPLLKITERFSGVDAKAGEVDVPEATLNCLYTLSDQLFVEPQPLLETIGVNGRQAIEMSEQERAIALSHVRVWDKIARSDHEFTLILEDDVYFTTQFAPVFEEVWANLLHDTAKGGAVDLLYLSFEEAKGGAEKEYLSEYVMRPIRGLWNLSGYVLSKEGAQKLLRLLPVRGPVDLWMNHQFQHLSVFSSTSSLIEQRRDYSSSNSYSVLPTLSKFGVLADEGPAKFEMGRLPGPVFAIGPPDSGLTSLAMALSMLGYRCCSDVEGLPRREEAALVAGRRDRIFNAYVNVGSVSRQCLKLAMLYPESRVIIRSKGHRTVAEGEDRFEAKGIAGNKMSMDGRAEELPIAQLVKELQRYSVKYLLVPVDGPGNWAKLCEFLECESPVGAFPLIADQRRRRLDKREDEPDRGPAKSKRLQFDRSPWIIERRGEWQGVPTVSTDACCGCPQEGKEILTKGREFGSGHWTYRDDTFPGNLVLFRPQNFRIEDDNCGVLTLRRENAYVRDYTSASISSQQSFLYGKFEAEIKPASVSGVITGMFLHRSTPRQEIDVEFLGRDCRMMLTNVYYNPGVDGSKFDYGYRGTPILIKLDFDASEDYHSYSIEWTESCIRWFVDDQLVHERANWEPTPIPHLPMRFHINLWASRSRKLGGRVRDNHLPTQSRVRRVKWCSLPL